MAKKEIDRALRGIQITTSVTAMAFSIAFITQTQYWDGLTANLSLAAAFACGDMVVLSGLSVIFVKERHELWSLAVALDGIALVCGLVAITCTGIGASSIADFLWIAPVLILLLGLGAYLGTLVRTVRARRERVGLMRPKDPLQPYLMKKEIDVWCYPVQQDNSQPIKQYVLASDDIERARLGPPLGPPQESHGLPQSSEGLLPDDGKPLPQQPPHAIPPPSIAETTAQWSVPSGNETYRMSTAISMRAPSTMLPEYATAGPGSVRGQGSLYGR